MPLLREKVAAMAEPARAPELGIETMQTSLSRLPSIRMVAGWLLLVALLFLTFIFTHQP
jgi:hypothetical protein